MLPAMQEVQLVAPAALNWPATQEEQTVSVVAVHFVEAKYPAVHTLHGLQELMPAAGAKVLAGQAEQALEPAAAKVPASHLPQTVLLVVVQAAPPVAVGELPAGHERHVEQIPLPTVSAYVPVAHGTHDAPAAENWPLAHGEQTVFEVGVHAAEGYCPSGHGVQREQLVEEAVAA